MIGQTTSTLHRLLATIGLAIVTLVLLLSWNEAQRGSVQAFSHEPETGQADVWQDFGTAWTSLDPVTTTITRTGGVWPILVHNVTVTFRFGSMPSDFPAVMTFTPQSQSVISPPLVPSTYFFTLEGTYQSGGAVSMNEYDIALQYQVSELNGAQESTLRFYQYETGTDRDDWMAQTGTVDTTRNIVECETDETGLFGIAGYRYQTFLPLVLRQHG